jgi:glycine C-acetyltransferase
MLQMKDMSLKDRAKYFESVLVEHNDRGHALYAREIVGASDHRVMMKDSISNSVKEMIMFGSNNYLGLGNHPEVKQKVKNSIESYGVGVGGPPLLNGTTELHRELESRLAQFKGKEDAILFPSGFQANFGWLGALVNKGDLLLYDASSHASLFDGIKILKSDSKITCKSFPHSDFKKLEEILEKLTSENSYNQIFISVEGVYSMDGDLAPLDEFSRVAKKFNAFLVVDDAHGTGVTGPNGSGTVKHYDVTDKVDLIMGTFSKSFSTTGGFIAGDKDIITYLRFYARSYMFSASMSPLIVTTVLAGLDLIENDFTVVEKLKSNIEKIVTGLKDLGLEVTNYGSAIIPLLVPEKSDIRTIGKSFHEHGIFVNPIEFPAVPKHLQRFRISVMSTHTDDDIKRLLEVVSLHVKDLSFTY